MSTKIPISKGKRFAIVDDGDVELVSQYQWTISFPSNAPDKIYAQSSTAKGAARIKMHRLIMGVGKNDCVVDHINGNTLDNRRINLRVCKHGENTRNFRRTSGQIGVRGISKTRTGKFRARIRLNGIGYHIGQFDTLHDASVAYAFASQVFHGEFGSLPGHDAFVADESRHVDASEDVSVLEEITTARCADGAPAATRSPLDSFLKIA